MIIINLLIINLTRILFKEFNNINFNSNIIKIDT